MMLSHKSSKRKLNVASLNGYSVSLPMYVSVISLKEPQLISDLFSYMNLIIEVHLKYSGDAWQECEWYFRQRVALTT